MPSYGNNVRIGMTKEASYNAAWAAPGATSGLWLQQESLNWNFISQDINAFFATGIPLQRLTEFARGLKSVEGSFKMNAHKQQLNWILFHLFGKVVTSVVGAANGVDGGQGQKHIYAIGTITPPSFGLVIQFPESGVARQFQLTGCVIEKVEIDFVMGQPVIMTINFKGADFAEAALTGTPSYNVVTTGEAWYKYPSAVSGLMWNINSLTAWGNVKVTLERAYADGTEESYEGGSNIRKRLESAAEGPVFKATISAQRMYRPTDLYTVFNSDVTFEAYYRDIAGPDGTGYHIGINLGKCKAKPPAPVLRGKSLIDEKLELSAFYDQGTTYIDNDLNITVVDKQTQPATQGS